MKIHLQTATFSDHYPSLKQLEWSLGHSTPCMDSLRLLSVSSASGHRKKPVPICTAEAPSSKAAAVCRASAMPPVAITGIFTASTICGNKALVEQCVRR